MRGHLIVAALVGASALGACASTGSSQEPAWFSEREQSVPNTFPSLRDVPSATNANTDAAYWARLQADLTAAGAEVRNNPRSQPATAADDPNLFLEQARADLERARLAHEHN